MSRLGNKESNKRRPHAGARVIQSAESPMFVGLSKIPKVEDRQKAVNRLILGAR